MYMNASLALDTALKELHEFILPELKTPQARLSGQLVTMILSFLATADDDSLKLESAARHKNSLSLLSEAVHILQQSAGGSTVNALQAGVAALGQTADEFSAATLAGLLELAQTAIVPLANRSDGAAKRWVTRLIDLEIRHLTDSNKVQSMRLSGNHANFDVKEQKVVLAEDFNAYLRRRFPAFPDVVTDSIQEVAGGFSKRTYLMSVRNAPPHMDRVVLRQDLPGGPTGTCVLDELPILTCVHRAGVPVPAVLWAESDASLFDAPFIVMECLRGTTDIEEWRKVDANGRRPIDELARHLARLHQLPTEGLITHARSANPRKFLREYIERFEERWLTERIISEPTLKLAFDWMKDNIPENIERLSIVHGDISERNILLEEGSIRGILDWELWHVGDPNEEIAYAQPFIEKLIPLQEFLDIYYSHGGPLYRPENARFWKPWYTIRASGQISSALSTFVKGHNRTSKLCAAVLNYYPQMILGTNVILKEAFR